jgi:hypothetical protein
MAADALLDYVDPGPNESVPGKLAESGGGTGDASDIAAHAHGMGQEEGYADGFREGVEAAAGEVENDDFSSAFGSRSAYRMHLADRLRSLSPSPRQPTGEDRRERVVEAARVLDASARKHEEHGQNFPAFWIRDELDALRAALRSLSPAGDTNTSSPEGGTEGGKP